MIRFAFLGTGRARFEVCLWWIFWVRLLGSFLMVWRTGRVQEWDVWEIGC